MRSYRDVSQVYPILPCPDTSAQILAFLDIEAGVENSDDDGDEEDFDAPGI